MQWAQNRYPTTNIGDIRTNVTGAARTLQSALNSAGNPLDKYLTGLREQEKQKAMLAQQAIQNQMAEEGLGLKRQGLTLQEAEAERKAEVDIAKLIMQADAAEAQATQNLWSKENANKQLDLQKQGILGAEEDRRHRRDMEEGQIAGAFLTPTTDKVVEQKDIDVTSPDALYAKYAEMSEQIDQSITGPVSEQDKQAQYLEFLKKTDPTAYTRYTTPLSMAQREEIAREKGNKYLAENFPNLLPTPGRVIGWADKLFSSTSQADRDLAKKLTPTKAPGTPSYDEFTASQDFGAKQLTKDEAATAKAELYKALQSRDLQKEMGLTKAEKVDIVGRTTEQEMYKDMNDKILEYVSNNPNVSKAKILGMRKAAAESINKEISNRAETDKIKLERVYKDLDTQGKQDFELYKLKLEDTLRNRLTPMEQVKLANMVKTGELTEAKVEELNQKIKEGKSWF